jgi:hypothetical protein
MVRIVKASGAEGNYQEQQLVQQQFPPPQVVDAPGATVTVNPPVAVLPTWPEKLSIANPPY